MRYCQFVMGPAGAGKSTYCARIAEFCETTRRRVHVFNLDPAAENFEYPVAWDIRDIISLDDVTETLSFGPNGGLIYCMEFLIANLQVFDEALGHYEDDYIIFDCPGQIELYTHIPVMKRLVDHLTQNEYRVAGVYLLDSQFLDDPTKYFSGVLAALSAMVNLEIPHVNVMTKMDLVADRRRQVELETFLDPDPRYILEMLDERSTPKQKGLNAAIASLIEDFDLVHFLPMNKDDEESVSIVLQHVDNAIQYGEDEDVAVPRDLDDFEQDDGT
mmetsp:Transcript_17752/g.46329  ORF Transcript_17752/g.46329 Transcript_17752/m.46329 type:complete len:273 (+) Transcript_17752:328-1146(+)